MQLAQNGNIERLGIFFFYDKEGIVDDYIPVMLDDMTQHFTDFAIVCNGKLTAEGLEIFKRYTDNVIVRHNKGLDVWAYKTVLDSYGWKALERFDEIVLFNFTIMGPVYPFSEMFDAMAKKDLDFWGITKFNTINAAVCKNEYGYLPEHIQSHFHAYRKSLHTSKAFRDYWDNMPEIKGYADSVNIHESTFTKRFSDLGFRWDVYANPSDFPQSSYHPVLYNIVSMMKERRCPIFKRRSFFNDYNDVINNTVGNEAQDLYAFLRNCTSYDTDLIWQNMLRTNNLSTLIDNLHLNYVLPKHYELPQPESVQNAKIALLYHVYYPDLIPETIHYAQAMPKGSTIIFLAGSDEKIATLQSYSDALRDYHVEYRKIENRGRDISSLLVGGGSDVTAYDYVCFAHDKKTSQITPESIGEGFAYKCHENVLGSKTYVRNILSTFANNPRLGFLMPTPPAHGVFFMNYSFPWTTNFQGTKELLERLHCAVPMNPDIPAIAPLGTMFWFRGKALAPLLNFNWQYSDFPAEPVETDDTLLHHIERAYCYVAQSAGYYSGYCFNDQYAAVELTNLAHERNELVTAIANPWGKATMVDTVMSINRGKRFVFTTIRFLRRLLRQMPWIGKKMDNQITETLKNIRKKRGHEEMWKIADEASETVRNA